MEKQSSYVLVNGLRVHYLHWKADGEERPVVLLHGLASNARIWELTAPYLAQEGFFPVAPDLRGHGLTDKPDGDYGFDPFRSDLAAFLEACNLERPILVGHSWGAMVALDYASRQLFGPRAAAGIVLVDGGMTQLDDAGFTWEEARERLTPPRLSGMPLTRFIDLITENHSAWHPDELSIPIILANFEISENDTIAPHLTFERHMQIVRAMWDFQTYEIFKRLRCPALLVPALPPQPRSEDDEGYLKMKERGVERAQENNPRVQAHWMPDAIHDIPLQKPQELAAVIASFARSV